MKKVYNNSCGIDVHKELIVACFVHEMPTELVIEESVAMERLPA